MFSKSCLVLTLLVLFEASTCYQITSDTRLDEFPLQVRNFKNPDTFFRFDFFHHVTIEEIACPEQYTFDPTVNHCVTSSKNHGLVPVETCTVKPWSTGLHSNPDSCFSYYNCNEQQCCYLMSCPNYLVYNSTSGQCDYPRQAQCCEYVEKNPDRLVQ